MTLTAEAILALAPDDASAKAARGLVAPAKWPLLGASEVAVWGECSGSGAKPYQTQVDLGGPSFKCSCPSRKFPCKHGLALLLLRAQEPARFPLGEAPAWVAEWLSSRTEKAQRKEERQVEKATAPVDPQAAARREAQRWTRIETAAQELQRWLADQLTRGFGTVNATVLQTWLTMAARMVDAQAPGLGARVRDAAAGVHQGDDWPAHTLRRLGMLQLLCEAVSRRATLPRDVQADLRTAVGWPHEQAEVLADGERVPDQWTVLGCAVEERADKLTERRVWLHGAQSGRRAWLLEHAFGGRGFETAWLPGTSVTATMAFFPGASGVRALASDIVGQPAPPGWPAVPVDDEWLRVAHRVAACPWTATHPVVIRNAVPVRHGAGFLAVVAGRALPLDVGEADAWKLHAIAGGHAVQLMGEWDGQRLVPLTAWHDDTGGAVWTPERHVSAHVTPLVPLAMIGTERESSATLAWPGDVGELASHLAAGDERRRHGHTRAARRWRPRLVRRCWSTRRRVGHTTA